MHNLGLFKQDSIEFLKLIIKANVPQFKGGINHFVHILFISRLFKMAFSFPQKFLQ